MTINSYIFIHQIAQMEKSAEEKNLFVLKLQEKSQVELLTENFISHFLFQDS